MNDELNSIPRDTTTGIPQLDAALGGLQRGESTLIIGAEDSGKTALACQIAASLITQHKAGIFINTERGASMEERMISCLCGVGGADDSDEPTEWTEKQRLAYCQYKMNPDVPHMIILEELTDVEMGGGIVRAAYNTMDKGHFHGKMINCVIVDGITYPMYDFEFYGEAATAVAECAVSHVIQAINETEETHTFLTLLDTSINTHAVDDLLITKDTPVCKAADNVIHIVKSEKNGEQMHELRICKSKRAKPSVLRVPFQSEYGRFLF